MVTWCAHGMRLRTRPKLGAERPAQPPRPQSSGQGYLRITLRKNGSCIDKFHRKSAFASPNTSSGRYKSMEAKEAVEAVEAVEAGGIVASIEPDDVMCLENLENLDNLGTLENNEPKTQSEPKPEAESEPKPEAESEPKPEAESEPKPEPTGLVNAVVLALIDGDGNPKPVAPEPEDESKSEPEPKPEPKPVLKDESKDECKDESKDEPEPKRAKYDEEPEKERKPNTEPKTGLESDKTEEESVVNLVNEIPSALEFDDEVLKAVQDVIGCNKVAKDVSFVEKAASYFLKVKTDFEATVEENSTAVDEIPDGKTSNEKFPLSVEDFLEWAKAFRGRNTVRGKMLVANEFMNMMYLAYCTAVALNHLPEWIDEKCGQLANRAERCRDRKPPS